MGGGGNAGSGNPKNIAVASVGKCGRRNIRRACRCSGAGQENEVTGDAAVESVNNAEPRERNGNRWWWG